MPSWIHKVDASCIVLNSSKRENFFGEGRRTFVYWHGGWIMIWINPNLPLIVRHMTIQSGCSLTILNHDTILDSNSLLVATFICNDELWEQSCAFVCFYTCALVISNGSAAHLFASKFMCKRWCTLTRWRRSTRGILCVHELIVTKGRLAPRAARNLCA